MLRFLFCLCFVLASASDDDEFSAELELEGKKNFDFLVFSQIWPITSCDIWEARDPSNTCFLPKESKFIFILCFKFLSYFIRKVEKKHPTHIYLKFEECFIKKNFQIFFLIYQKLLQEASRLCPSLFCRNSIFCFKEVATTLVIYFSA